MQIGWIDFAREDRAKAMGILHLLQERIAVDELGFGIIRDAFADAFFPATSTIQTRAKYFLLIPYILKEATSGKYGYSTKIVRAKIDDLEHAAAKKMYDQNPDEPGLIGRTVLPRGWVARKPSDIYWNGIRELEIYKGNCSFSEYISGELAFCAAKNKGLGKKRSDEDGSGDDEDFGNSSPMGKLDMSSLYSENWMASLKMELTRAEAQYLENRILNSARSKGTLFAQVLRERVDLSKFIAASEGNAKAVPFELFANSMVAHFDLSERNRHLISMAGEFNKLVYAARVLYNEMMGNEAAAEMWQAIADVGFPRYATLDIDDMLISLGLSRNPRYCIFLCAFKEAMRRGNEMAMREAVETQEKRLKQGRAKLRSGKYASDKWIGGSWLDYRLSDAARILNDVYKGLGVSSC